MTSSKNFTYLAVPEVLPLAIEAGNLTMEEAEDAKSRYDAFVEELEAEWPDVRVKEFLLAKARRSCKYAAKKLADTELENKEARRKGISYADRQIYTKRMQAAKEFFIEWRDKGLKWSKQSFTARQFVTPLDVDFIQERGFDTHLNLVTL